MNTATSVTKAGTRSAISASRASGTRRGDRSAKMTPTASAPASTAITASSTLVQPQILTRVRVTSVASLRGDGGALERADRFAFVVGAHQRLADEHAARAAGDEPPHVLLRFHAALADHDGVARDER